MTGPRIGVVGATGAVGTITLELLAERGYDVRAFASARSAGTRLPFGDDEILVEEATAKVLSSSFRSPRLPVRSASTSRPPTASSTAIRSSCPR